MLPMNWNTTIQYAGTVGIAESVPPTGGYGPNEIGQIAVAGYTFLQTIYGDDLATDVDPPASPCGACRQLLAEFGLDLEVIAVGPKTERRWVLRDLLPDAFAKAALAT